MILFMVGNVVILVKKTDYALLRSPFHQIQKEYDQFATRLCEHIITQKSRGLDRERYNLWVENSLFRSPNQSIVNHILNGIHFFC